MLINVFSSLIAPATSFAVVLTLALGIVIFPVKVASVPFDPSRTMTSLAPDPIVKLLPLFLSIPYVVPLDFKVTLDKLSFESKIMLPLTPTAPSSIVLPVRVALSLAVNSKVDVLTSKIDVGFNTMPIASVVTVPAYDQVTVVALKISLKFVMVVRILVLLESTSATRSTSLVTC